MTRIDVKGRSAPRCSSIRLCSGAARWLSCAFVAAWCAACVSSRLEVGSAHPASLEAPSAPLARVGSALEANFDPLPAAAPARAPASAHEHEHAAPSDARWTCPMHPEIIRKEPGTCPICGMKLKPVAPKEAPKGSP